MIAPGPGDFLTALFTIVAILRSQIFCVLVCGQWNKLPVDYKDRDLGFGKFIFNVTILQHAGKAT